MLRPTIANADTKSILVLIQSTINENYLNPSCEVHRIKTISDLSTEILKQINPGIVLCPLFTLRYDAIDVGKMILEAEVNSKLLIESPTLPRPAMVAREISTACPELNFDFFDMQRWLNRCLMTA